MHWMIISARHNADQGGIGTYVQQMMKLRHGPDVRHTLVTRADDSLPQHPDIVQLSTIDQKPEFAARIAGLRRINRIRPYRYGLWSLAVAQFLLDYKEIPDVIEFVDTQAEGFVSLTNETICENYPHTKFLIHAHTPMFVGEQFNESPSDFGQPIYHEWERQALRNADGILVPSSITEQFIISNQCVICPPPLDWSLLDQNHTPTQDNTICCIGIVQPRKGVDVWAGSLNEVFAQNSKTQTVLVGPDTMTSPNGESMVQYVRSLLKPQHQSRFKWMNHLAQDELMQIVSQAALVVVPSQFESFSYSAAESVLKGIPTIMTDQVGFAEYLDDALIIPTNDETALAQVQLSVLANRKTEFDRTRNLQQQLLGKFDPTYILETRLACLDLIHTQKRHSKPDLSDSAAMMQNYLRSVEDAEQCVAH